MFVRNGGTQLRNFRQKSLSDKHYLKPIYPICSSRLIALALPSLPHFARSGDVHSSAIALEICENGMDAVGNS